jgi:outer membrane protein insertion porin family
MGRSLFPFAVALLFFCATTGMRAQSPGQNSPAKTLPSSKIATIAITGSTKIPADQVETASGLKAGEIVTAEQIQAAADRLAALGIFLAVNYRYTPKGNEIALEFHVTEAPTYPISFDNFPWFTDGEIGDAIRNSVGLFTDESPGSGAMVDQITAVLEKLLASRNIKGRVTHQLVAQTTGDGMMMQFSVEGTSLRIQSVQFGDALATESERLKSRISDIHGQPYSRFAIELFESEQIRPLYVSKGFLRAKIGPPVAHLPSDAGNPAGTGVDILIPITPGAAYSWKGVSWQGNTVFPAAILEATMQMKSGDIANGLKIENGWQTIKDGYGRRGYLDMKLKAQAQFDDAAHQISYQVTITEGAQYRMGEMVITGLSVEAEKRLRHDWQIAPGDIFDNGYYEGLAKELVKPNKSVFGDLPLHYDVFGHWLRANPDKHTVDVLFDFK